MNPAPNHRYRYRWLWRSGWALIVGVGLALKAMQSPLYLFGFGADDELFVRMAKGFLSGHWSSDWSVTNVNTLVKPVGFPLFLTGAHYLPWTPVVTEYGLYLIGASLIAWSWWRISESRAQATVVLGALALHPVWFSNTSLQIYRDSLINALATLAIGLAFVVAARIRTPAGSDGAPNTDTTAPVHRIGRRRETGRLRVTVLYLLTFAIGLTVGLVMIAKPTWQWLIVAVAAPFTFPLAHQIRQGPHRWKTVLAVLLAGTVLVSGAYGVVSMTKAMNSRTYHVALVEDLASGSFARAWKDWASVEAGPRQPDVAITGAMRNAVYDVSPRAVQLRPYLESPTDPWKAVDCASPLRICDNSGQWFEWDLRFAAATLPSVRSVEDLQNFFAHLADEIEAACRSGRLHCSSSPVLATGLPTLDQIPAGGIASYTASGLWQMVRADLPMSATPGPAPTRAQYAYWRSVVPGMSSFTTVQQGTTPSWVYSALRTMTTLFGLGNIVLLTTMVAGPSTWFVRRLLRRPSSRRADWWAATCSSLFFLSALIGTFVLAVYAAAVGGLGYTSQQYWADFATPTELCIVLGAFASWPVLRGRSTVSRNPRRTSGQASTNDDLETGRIVAPSISGHMV